jgi:broad specificity phosphatase PhoE
LLSEALRADGRPVATAEHRGLMEIGQGDWSGRTHVEIERAVPDRYAAWRAGGGEVIPPGGETVAEATSRIVAALDELLAPDEATLCLVSHGGILRLAAGHLLGLSVPEAWRLDVDNASLSRLGRPTADGRWRVEAWNDTAHLGDLPGLPESETDGAPLAL